MLREDLNENQIPLKTEKVKPQSREEYIFQLYLCKYRDFLWGLITKKKNGKEKEKVVAKRKKFIAQNFVLL